MAAQACRDSNSAEPPVSGEQAHNANWLHGGFSAAPMCENHAAARLDARLSRHANVMIRHVDTARPFETIAEPSERNVYKRTPCDS